MKKFLLIIVIIGLIFSGDSILALMSSPNYRIDEDSLIMGGIDIYKIGLSKESAIKNNYPGQKIIDSLIPFWKIVLAGLVGLFLIIWFFKWITGKFEIKRKTPLVP